MVWACFYVVGWSAEFGVRDFEWLAGGLFVGVFSCGYCYGFSVLFGFRCLDVVGLRFFVGGLGID